MPDQGPIRKQIVFPFSKYLQAGQQAFVHIPVGAAAGETEKLLSAVIDRATDRVVELSLSYDATLLSGYRFVLGERLKISTEHFGVGITGYGEVMVQPKPGKLWLVMVGNLEVFYRRKHMRFDCATAYALVHRQLPLEELVTEWRALEEQPEEALKRYALKSGTMNVSAGGFSVTTDTPLQENDIDLLIFQRDPRSAPIVALAEVVWTHPEKNAAGHRFVILRPDDQKKIEQMVWRMNKSQPK